MADIPAGTGLGSSGSFTTALLKALHAHKKNLVHPAELAAQACDIELDRLHEPIGKQDQYIAAYGGITCFEFLPDGTVKAWPLKISDRDTEQSGRQFTPVFHRLFAFGIGDFEGAGPEIETVRRGDDRKSALRQGPWPAKSERALESGNLHEFARLMDVQWQRKKQRSSGMSNPKINEWYDLAMASGALGGKLIGAGGGGFLMFYADDKAKLRHAMRQAGLKEVRFRFDFEGTKLVIS